MKKIMIGIIVLLIVGLGSYKVYEVKHTFTLSDDIISSVTMKKTELIQPITGTIKVSSSVDTSVTFIDEETNEQYNIGYITPGMTEKIKLEKGHWYYVLGGGELTLGPVDVKIND